jgi:hypothetical protein
MSARQNIIDYLRRKSGGLLNITNDMATEIIDIARNDRIEQSANAKLFRYNMQKKAFEILYTVPATDELVKKNIKESLNKAPVNECYMWECYNSEGHYEGKILTTDTNLF